MCCRGVSFFPIMVGIVMATSVVTTYVIAVLRGDVTAMFPYISDTGIDVPESCIFSQFFNIASFLAFLTMYLRYKLIQELTKDFDPKVTKLSKANFVIGSLSCAGLSIVGNFQETKIEAMHVTGAMLVFGCGTLFAYIDAIISYKMHPIYNGIFICRVRLLIASASLVSFVTTFVAGSLSLHMWYTNLPADDRQHWKPTDPGYPAHLVSTFGEWAMAFSFLLYFFTYIRDFQKFHIEVVPTVYVSNLDDEPILNVNQPNETTGLLA